MNKIKPNEVSCINETHTYPSSEEKLDIPIL